MVSLSITYRGYIWIIFLNISFEIIFRTSLRLILKPAAYFAEDSSLAFQCTYVPEVRSSEDTESKYTLLGQSNEFHQFFSAILSFRFQDSERAFGSQLKVLPTDKKIQDL